MYQAGVLWLPSALPMPFEVAARQEQSRRWCSAVCGLVIDLTIFLFGLTSGLFVPFIL